MIKTSFITPCSPFPPPNKTALLSSTVVKVKTEHGGGLSPVVAGQLHTPAVEIEETSDSRPCKLKGLLKLCVSA